MPPPWRSHGTGRFDPADLGSVGERVVIEDGVRIFNPAHVHLGDDVYVGHGALLRGDTRGELRVGDGSWLGHGCHLQSAGGIFIGRRAGVGPNAVILTSTHAETPRDAPIFERPLELASVEVGDGADVGAGAILLPGARVGARSLVGAGAVVGGEFPDHCLVAGVPARVIRRWGEP
jgi:acetyltransferase-like isoleucine patch superfamily enzyme